ncbi:MAG: AMP-binding protein [Acidimicrobiia bacterium]|nr:AMP-binding protein [Acidimicrobiia bacterium]
MSSNLLDRFDAVSGAAASAPVTFWDADGTCEKSSWPEVLDHARGRAARLQSRDIGPGSRVAVLGLTSRPLVETILGSVMCGAAVTVLPLPMRLGSQAAFVEATRGRIAAARADVLVVDDFLGSQYEPAPSDPPVVSLSDLEAGLGTPRFERVRAAPSDLAVLQFTSGSTADPRAVRLHHGAICANATSIVDAAQITPGDDHVVSWLPLYHDMGLIGTVFVPATTGTPLTLLSPQSFLSRPASWMELTSAQGGTLTAAPNFAYALAARGLRRATGLDLGRLRVSLCGAEPIDADTIRTYVEAGRPFGLPASTPFCCYGLAEATLAVTFPHTFDGMHSDTVNRTALEHERHAEPCASGPHGKEMVALGGPLRGTAVRIVDVHGTDLPERQAGEVLVASSSLMQGYDGHPTATARTLRDGWLWTGDIGYVAGGDLYLCGRSKDMIIVGGRNIWPQDVEAAAQSVPGVRAGNAVAFGIERRPSKEAIVLVAETRLETKDARGAAAEVARAIRESVGLAPRDVVLVAPGCLPKTSSGKLQRSLTRQRYEEGAFAGAATTGDSGPAPA